MKILVLSDSHAALSFMRYCIDRVKPDHVIHLGDHFDDGLAMAEEYKGIRFHLVPGNCDAFRCDPTQPLILNYPIGGVQFYMTHGHKHGVKSGLERLVADALAAQAQVVLFGHTHSAVCCQVQGMWVVNPGTCGTYGGSAALLKVADGKVNVCQILKYEDMESLCQND